MRTESALRLLGIHYPFANFRANVEAAYRKLAVKLHPDKGGCPEAFLLLQEAREICLGQAEPAEEWTWKDRACKQLCADPRIRNIHEQASGGWSDDSGRRLAEAKHEITKLRMEACIAKMKREAQVAREEAEARRQDELERQRREAAAREAAAREAERRARERQEREAEMRRRREAEMQQQTRENLRSRADFKPYMPRIWPQLSATQVKKKTAFLKRLRSLRTMKKRAQDAGRSVSSYNAKIEDIFREAWAMHRDVSSDTTA